MKIRNSRSIPTLLILSAVGVSTSQAHADPDLYRAKWYAGETQEQGQSKEEAFAGANAICTVQGRSALKTLERVGAELGIVAEDFVDIWAETDTHTTRQCAEMICFRDRYYIGTCRVALVSNDSNVSFFEQKSETLARSGSTEECMRAYDQMRLTRGFLIAELSSYRRGSKHYCAVTAQFLAVRR